MGETLKGRLNNVVDDGVNAILNPSTTTEGDSSVYDGEFYFTRVLNFLILFIQVN